MKGGHGQTNQFHDINWGALDHASSAPQLMSCNYCVCVWHPYFYNYAAYNQQTYSLLYIIMSPPNRSSFSESVNLFLRCMCFKEKAWETLRLFLWGSTTFSTCTKEYMCVDGMKNLWCSTQIWMGQQWQTRGSSFGSFEPPLAWRSHPQFVWDSSLACSSTKKSWPRTIRNPD